MKVLMFIFLIIGHAHASEEQSIPLLGTVSSWFEVNIAPTSESFLLTIESESKTPFYVSDLIDPSGQIYIKSNHGSPSATRIPPFVYTPIHSSNRVTLNTKGLGSALVPNALDTEIKAGVWKVRIASLEPAQSARLKIHQKNRAHLSPKLDLIVRYQPTDWQNESQLQEILEQVENLYHKFGIELKLQKKISYKKEVHSSLDTFVEAIQSTKTKEAIIYLQAIEKLPGNKDLQGYAGCLPFFEPKNKHCAIGVWFKKDTNIENERITKVIAHEIAHFLGLYHLEDDYYPFGRLRSTLVTSEDDQLINIMHGTSEYFGELIFSEAQARTIKLHPLLYPKL